MQEGDSAAYQLVVGALCMAPAAAAAARVPSACSAASSDGAKGAVTVAGVPAASRGTVVWHGVAVPTMGAFPRPSGMAASISSIVPTAGATANRTTGNVGHTGSSVTGSTGTGTSSSGSTGNKSGAASSGSYGTASYSTGTCNGSVARAGNATGTVDTAITAGNATVTVVTANRDRDTITCGAWNTDDP